MNLAILMATKQLKHSPAFIAWKSFVAVATGGTKSYPCLFSLLIFKAFQRA